MPVARNHTGSNRDRSEHYGALQRIVDVLYADVGAELAAYGEEELTVRRLDVVIQAEAADLPEELMRIVTLVPPGNYTRQRLCDQLNSAINGHAWGQVYGTVS